MDTEYRILPVPSDAVGTIYYLQFKTLKLAWFKGVKEVWKFVPKFSYKKTILNAKDCPEKLDHNDHRLIRSFNNDYSLKVFAESWPDINLYFDNLESLVVEYENKSKENKITYL